MSKSENYDKVKDEALALLRGYKREWEPRYYKYACELKSKEEKIKKRYDSFSKNIPFSVYTSISDALEYHYDLRFNGQSVAKLEIKGKEGAYERVFTVRKDKKGECFGIIWPEGEIQWDSDEGKRFRDHFLKLNGSQLHKSQEHRIENLLLKEFRKILEQDGKPLRHIQPVRLFNKMFFQMPTPFCASEHGKERWEKKPGRGGGIDILARVSTGRGTRLCVMELKDENSNKESPDQVMRQAVYYATFLSCLLKSNFKSAGACESLGEKWYRLFGFEKEIDFRLPIDVAVVMPYEKERSDSFGQELEIILPDIGKEPCALLNLYSLYFDFAPKPSSKFEFHGDSSLITKGAVRLPKK